MKSISARENPQNLKQQLGTRTTEKNEKKYLTESALKFILKGD